jgi:elongation factor G
MSFVRSLLGGLPGRVSFKAATASFAEATPQNAFSLFPITMGRRWNSSEAEAKDLVSVSKKMDKETK